ncbi:bifunctional pyruvate/2-ketobutyrate formate lyase, partial [Escherichia coli]|nr:bifunctional pyruvate/2-ketobutyrate formate lyase [Escherichia coli]
YEGNDSFLAGPTEATSKLWEQVMQLSKEERERGGMWDMDTKVASTITSHDAGYLDKDLETIVGVQTEKPFKRSMQPFGGIRMAKAACEAYGYELDEETEKIFTDYRKTHNQGVFDAYSREMLNCRRAGVITGLPDAYGRGRIIGDYRRVALYGVDFLMEEKMHDFNTMSTEMSEDVIR